MKEIREDKGWWGWGGLGQGKKKAGGRERARDTEKRDPRGGKQHRRKKGRPRVRGRGFQGRERKGEGAL